MAKSLGSPGKKVRLLVEGKGVRSGEVDMLNHSELEFTQQINKEYV